MSKSNRKTNQEIYDMIQLCGVESTTRTIAQLLDILQAMAERIDDIESKNKQTQNERNHPNKY